MASRINKDQEAFLTANGFTVGSPRTFAQNGRKTLCLVRQGRSPRVWRWSNAADNGGLVGRSGFLTPDAAFVDAQIANWGHP